MCPDRPGRRARLSVPLLIVTLLLGAGAGAGAYYVLGYFNQRSAAGDGGGVAAGREGEISALGRLEPADGVIDILGPTGDSILALGDVNDKGEPLGEPLQEGAEVKKDVTVLAVLKSWQDRKRDLEFAQSQLKTAEDQRRAIETSGDRQIEVAKLAVTQAEQAQKTEPEIQQGGINLIQGSLDLAQQQYDAMRATATPKLKLDELKLQVEKLRTEKANAETQKRIAAQTAQLSIDNAKAKLALAESEKKRTMAEVPVEAARSRLEMARVAFERTKLKAPRDGKILKIYAQPGEVLTARPIMTVADTSRMVAVTEVYETDVKALRERLRAGKAVPARVVSPALPGAFDRANPRESAGALKGHVVSVGTQIARNRVFDVNPAADVDRRVVDVRVQLDDAATAAGFINLQVTVYLDLK